MEDRFYPDEMFDAAEKAHNHLTLTHEEMLEIAERREKSNRVLKRYNDFYNLEVSGLPHGTPTSMEQVQALALQCALNAIIYDNSNQKHKSIEIADIENLIEALYEQGNEYLEKVKTTWGPKE